MSAGNLAGFDFFDQYFRQLEINERTKATLGDSVDRVMYSGFFVVRSRASEPYFHEDYTSGLGMNALTLMTPVMPISEKGHLLYMSPDEDELVYNYEPGTAVSFGADFYHSTQPFVSPEPYAFLAFTYGTSDSRYWKLISETVGYQGVIYRDPQRGIVAV